MTKITAELNIEQYNKIIKFPTLTVMVNAMNIDDHDGTVVNKYPNPTCAVKDAKEKVSKATETTYLIYKLVAVVQPPGNPDISWLEIAP